MPTLDWIGKKAVVNHHNEVPFHLLREEPELSVGKPGSGNLIVEGDNLTALKALLPYYAGQVKCIYIDPPYNTGNENWVYNDNVNSPEIRKWLGKTVGKEVEDLSRHDKWLCMMYPRLALLREFLQDDGVIFISIDDNELANLNILVNEIFGVSNVLATLVWEKGKKGDAKFFSVSHEYIVVAGKSKSTLIAKNTKWRRNKPGVDQVLSFYNGLKDKHNGDQVSIRKEMMQWYKSLPAKHPSKAHKHYNWSDDRSLYFAADFSGPDDGRENRPRYDILHPITGKSVKKPSTGWRWEESKTLEALAEIPPRIHFGPDETTIPCRKSYLFEIDSEPFPSVFYKDGRAATLEVEQILGAGSFAFPKDSEILADLIGIVCTKEDIVLDSFAGSGTTGHAVMQLNKQDGGNRRFILVEMEPAICRDVTTKRVQKVAAGYQNAKGETTAGLGSGFRYCTLGEPCFDETGRINPRITYDELARHVYFTETGEPIPETIKDRLPLIGIYGDRAIYLLYNGVLKDKKPNGGNVLTQKVLAGLPPHDGPRVIYGTACRLSPPRLKKETADSISDQGEMMLQLKTYQEKVLDSLRLYFQTCDRLKNADSAFYETTKVIWERGIPYRSITEPSELADIPYVCLRLPTGGGKTLLACHAIAIANRDFLKMEHSIVLWLVPSNAIRTQTIKALRDRNHPYRQALDSTLSNVEVMDVEEALRIRQGVVSSSTVVIVATLQAFRVEDKEGRKVYESAGALHHHFQNLPVEILSILDKDENGVINYSLANVMRIHRPLVIVDEAHNARTDLSFDTLARFRPSAIVEFTATPDSVKSPSNILHSVSAAELKAEYMIKLPIRLEAHTDWQALLADAIAQRAELEKDAEIEERKTGDYIRPIMLIQAQPHRQAHETLTVEVIEKSLIADHRIPADQIARATGEDRGLENVDLSEKDCPIRFIITMQALREGWDCPFAYVLCSVAEQRSVGAVEQILGRVLRLPNCRERTIDDLNRAYAFVTSRDFAEAAKGLVDALVENGFNRLEAREFIRPVQPQMDGFVIPKVYRTPSPKKVDLVEVPRVEQLSPQVQAKIDINTDERTITIKYVLTQEEEKEVRENLLMHDSRKVWADAVKEHREEAMGIVKSPSEKGVPFKVPFLCIRRDGQLELFEEDQLMEEGWEIENYDSRLTGDEVSLITEEKGQFGEIDVGQGGKIRSRFIPELNKQLQLIEVVENWTESQLIYWLDYNLREFIELTPEEKEGFLATMVGDLVDQRSLGLSQLVRKKFILRKIAEEKLKGFKQEARARIHQQLLFKDGADIVVTPERAFSYGAEYPTRFICLASDSFTKHYYPKVGDLDDKGEEFMCALFIDRMDEVEVWVRNLDRQPALSFWLQTSTDRFYPDFVCKLKDGRYLVVECKGADRWSNDDSKEKRRLGELWALKSNGKCLFVMPKGKDWDAIKALVKQ